MKHELIKFSLAGMNKWIFNQTALHTNWLLLTLSNVLPDSITEVQEKLKGFMLHCPWSHCSV